MNDLMDRSKRYFDDSRCSWQFHDDVDGWVRFNAAGERLDFLAAWMGDPIDYHPHLQFYAVYSEAKQVDFYGDIIELPPVEVAP